MVYACFKCPAPARAVGDVGSHSDIYDMPVYPDDTAPKTLEGQSLAIEWFPFVSATCKDENGNFIIFVVDVCIFKGKWAGFQIYLNGQTYSYNANTNFVSYTNGVLTIGTMPRVVVNYRLPHKITYYVTAGLYFEFTVAFRGSPLWYSKQVNQTDMLPVHQDLIVGGYDAPSELNGFIYNYGTVTRFKGYGNCEHTWLLGNASAWNDMHEAWMYFNDENSYGVVVEFKNTDTGELLMKTGRLWSNGQTYVFDNFTWKDDGETGITAPKLININGFAENESAEVPVNLLTIPEESFEPFEDRPYWKFHRIIGTIGGLEFNGYSHCEVRRIFSYPVVNPLPNPNPTPTSSPSPSPSFFPSPSPSLSPSPSPLASQKPIPTEKPQPTPSPPAEIIYSVAVGISCAVIVTLTFLLKRKRHPRAKEQI